MSVVKSLTVSALGSLGLSDVDVLESKVRSSFASKIRWATKHSRSTSFVYSPVIWRWLLRGRYRDVDLYNFTTKWLPTKAGNETQLFIVMEQYKTSAQSRIIWFSTFISISVGAVSCFRNYWWRYWFFKFLENIRFPACLKNSQFRVENITDFFIQFVHLGRTEERFINFMALKEYTVALSSALDTG